MNEEKIMDGTGRGRLMVKYLTPTILSNLSIFLFTIVDGIFVGRGAGSNALGAVNIVFPYVMFFNAFIMLVTIGGLTIAAIRIGKKDYEGANEIFMHCTVMSLVVSAVFSMAAIFFTEPICRLLGAGDTYIGYACDYLFWYGVFMIPCGIYTTFNGFIRNDGHPGLVSISVIISTGLNILGDWLLIFPFGMALKGAAIATGAAQTTGLLIVIWHFILKKGKMTFHRFRFSKALAGKAIVRGIPECIAQFCTPISTIVMNLILAESLGDSAINAYSIIGYVASFSIAIFYGVADGLQPLFGQCYGSKNLKDLAFYKWAGLIIGGVGSAVITFVIVLLEKVFCSLYGADAGTTEVVLKAMPQYAIGFVLQAFTVIISAYLYSTTRTKQAIVINIVRSFVVNLAVTLILPRIFGTGIIWFTFAIYEGIVMVMAFILMFAADKGGVKGAAE